jgi:carbon-monoxide dehydrogenase small subunit
MPPSEIAFEVNGEPRTVAVHPLARLLDVLRESLRLPGTKEGCGEGECGACSVLVDGVLVNACLVPVVQVAGRKITTIEGLAEGGVLTALQRELVRGGGAQCGICTPGMVMAAHVLLRDRPRASEAEIREALAGNLCRCTGYVKIVESVARACAAEREP